MPGPIDTELVPFADDMDTRTVAVIWSGDEPLPDVSWSGCSAYEAIGLLRVAAQKLEYDFRLLQEEEEDDD